MVRVNEAQTPGGLLKIQVTLYNSTHRAAAFNYKFEWFDANGMIVDSPLSIWSPQTIDAYETIQLTSLAPLPSAKDFRLKLQQSNNN